MNGRNTPAVRLTLAGGGHAPEAKQWRRVRRCGIILLTANFALSAMVLMVLFVGKRFLYQGVLVYAMAVYCFYSVIHVAIGLVKNRRYVHPLDTAARAVSLSAALVSILALETAMLAQFGADMAEDTRRIFIALTGAGVSAGSIGVSLWMLRRAHRALKGK